MIATNASTQFCFVRYPNGMGHTTVAPSVFAAAANAIQWMEVECRTFGTARALRDSEILHIRVGMTEGPSYRMRVGRIREWLRGRVEAARRPVAAGVAG
jgi:hypothetical protein